MNAIVTSGHSVLDLLYFSRGRGKGHAVPDLDIARELRQLCPGIELQFASYAIGAEVFAAAKMPVIDLGMPEANPLFETIVRASHVIKELRPRIIVSHEELPVLPAAAICNRPSVYLSHWFPSPLDPVTEALRYATEVLFMERDGVFPEPSQVKGRVHYVGPFTRRLEYGPNDRVRARGELGIAPEEKLILVLPGSPPENATPTCDLILKALDILPYDKTRVVWIAGKDHDYIATCAANRAEVTVLGGDCLVERFMVACDVAITKGTYNIGRELVALGVRSISLSHGTNFIDDLYARTFHTNVALYATETTPALLARQIETAVAMGRVEPDVSVLRGNSAALFARHLARIVAAAH